MPSFDDLARSQHGLLTRAQVREAGLTDAHWRRGLADGRLEALFPGIARIEGYPTDDLQRIMAGVLLGGATARASHRSALVLWGCELSSSDVDVLVPLTARPRSRHGVHFHRSRDRLDLAPTARHGIPTVSAPRALVDLGEVAEHLLDTALADLAVQRLVAPRVARATAERHARRGRAGASALLRALERWPSQVELPDSRFEVELARRLHTEGLGDFVFHPVICGYEVDFSYPDGLVVEADGFEFHRDRDAFERDRRRDADLVAAGWRVMRITWRQFRDDPDATLRRIRLARAV